MPEARRADTAVLSDEPLPPAESGPCGLVLGLLIGFAGAVFVPFLVYWYEVIVQPVGMPQVVLFSLSPLVFFLMFLLCGVVNPLVARFLPGAALGRRETVLIFAMWLVAGALYWSGAGAAVFTCAMGRYDPIYSKDVRTAKVTQDLKEDLFFGPEEMRGYYYGESLDTRSLIRIWPRTPLFRRGDYADLNGLIAELLAAEDASAGRPALSRFIAGSLREETRRSLAEVQAAAAGLPAVLVRELNAVIAGPSLYEPMRFRGVQLAEGYVALDDVESLHGEDLLRHNRRLLEAAYPGRIVARRPEGAALLGETDLVGPARLARRIIESPDGVSAHLRHGLSDAGRAALEAYSELALRCEDLLSADLNAVLASGALGLEGRLEGLTLSDETRRLLGELPPGAPLPEEIGRRALEEAYSGLVAPRWPAVPWRLWFVHPEPTAEGPPRARPGRMAFWMLFVLTTCVLAIALTRMMHRQWSQHELIAYPIAEVAHSVIARSRGRMFPDMFYSTAYWMGFVLVFLIYVINGLHKWYPQFVEIPIEFEHRNLLSNFPFLYYYCGSQAYSLLRGWVWPFMTAIAVLLPREVSLSSWLGYTLVLFGSGFYFLVTGDAVQQADEGYLRIGMCVAAFLAILYPGRREYARLLRMALRVRIARDDPRRGSALACRLYLASCAALFGLMVYAGVHWMIALFAVGAYSMLTVLLARLTAEVGMPWLAGLSRLVDNMALMLFGAAAIGPKSLVMLSVLSAVMCGEVSNTVAAQETTVGRLVERGGAARWGRLGNGAFAVGLLLALGASVFFTVWLGHSLGGRMAPEINRVVAALNRAGSEIRPLQIEGAARVARLDRLGALGKLAEATQPRRFWSFFGAGFLIVAGCAFMRHRKAWWPLHPLPLVLFNTWNLSRLYHSFMVGWIIKTALVKIWGGETYRRTRPFFFGAVMGQIVSCGFLMAIDTLYHYLTWQNPSFYRYFA